MIKTKAALRTQVEAAAQGAMGHCSLDLDEGDANPLGLFATMGLEDWFRFVSALREMFRDDVFPRSFELYELHHFETVTGSVEHLWACRRGDDSAPF